MKLATNQIAGFLQHPNPAVRVILIYGPDAGLVAERAQALAKQIVSDLNDPFRVSLLTGSSLSDDPARLHDEMAAQALGGGRRLVRLQHALENTASALAKTLEDLPGGDSLLLIEAGDLDKRSKLRSLCESPAPEVCAVPCYVEDAGARQRTASDILQNAGLRISRELLVLLEGQLPPDRIALRSEVEKLALYCHGKKSVELEDIQATITDAGAAEADELIFLVASGDVKKTASFADHLFAEQVSAVAILRAAQRHFVRLQWARSQVDQGLSAREAVDKLQPRVFWKYVSQMTQQVGRWPSGKIEKVLQRLTEAEAAVKRTGTPDQTLTAQLLVQIANLAK